MAMLNVRTTGRASRDSNSCNRIGIAAFSQCRGNMVSIKSLDL